MNFRSNRLPSTLQELQWYWGKSVMADINFSRVVINEKKINFTKPIDYFDLTDIVADKISFIGRSYDFFTQPIALKEFELNIFGDLNADTQIGVLLSNVNRVRTVASAYGIYATFTYINKSVYCALTVCLVDKDIGIEMETAIVEIGQDEGAFILPISINKEALNYFNYDDIAKLSYWLGNFWAGIQYEMNNCPEEIRIIKQRDEISENYEEFKKNNHIVLVKRIIQIDEDGNIIKHGASNANHEYTATVWGVRGHYRTLPDGRVIYICPYCKGKDRNKQGVYNKKEYRFINDKLDSDID